MNSNLDLPFSRLAWALATTACLGVSCKKSAPVSAEAVTEPVRPQTAAGTPGSMPAGPDLNLDNVPSPTPQDERFRGVFAGLDGEWQGTFRIYVNPEGQADGPSQPEHINPRYFKRPPFKLDSTIQVRQSYVSDSPFFQRVKIEDRMPDGTVVKSEGVNKVEGGKLWCLVKKPDDFVVHDGSFDGRRTIVWTRSRKTPLAVERFVERVTPERYTIIGWGYYGNDDPQKAPRMYFEAEYTRPAL